MTYIVRISRKQNVNGTLSEYQTVWIQDEAPHCAGPHLDLNFLLRSSTVSLQNCPLAVKDLKAFINSFSAKLNIAVWDYFHIQYYKSFKKAKKRINHKYLLTFGHGLNTSENSEV